MEILDEVRNRQNENKTYSILSFIFGLSTVFLIGYIFAQIPTKLTASERFSQPSIYLINGMRISCILGITLAILSFTKKEPSSILKWAGATLNFLSFIGIFGSILFAIFMKMGH